MCQKALLAGGSEEPREVSDLPISPPRTSLLHLRVECIDCGVGNADLGVGPYRRLGWGDASMRLDPLYKADLAKGAGGWIGAHFNQKPRNVGVCVRSRNGFHRRIFVA